jgi:hypothetical protein
MGAFLVLGNWYYNLMRCEMTAWSEFSWCGAWMVGAIALLLGLLGQFFFGKAGSIAEPL